MSKDDIIEIIEAATVALIQVGIVGAILYALLHILL
jgi:hypothetical protein